MERFIEGLFKFYITYSPLEKGKSRLINLATHLFSGRKKKYLTSFGAYMSLDLSQYVDSNIYFRGQYEKNILLFIKQLKEKFDVDYFIDAGANIGQHSLYCAKELNITLVYSFEANPYVYNRLVENIKDNELDKYVHPYNLALSDDDGEIVIVVPDDRNLGGAYIQPATHSKNSKKSIKAVKLDDSINEIGKSGILKIDVEGAEALVLKGANRLLESGTIKAIFIEICDKYLSRFGYERNDIFNLLESHGYYGKVIIGSRLEEYNSHKSAGLLEMVFIMKQD